MSLTSAGSRWAVALLGLTLAACASGSEPAVDSSSEQGQVAPVPSAEQPAGEVEAPAPESVTDELAGSETGSGSETGAEPETTGAASESGANAGTDAGAKLDNGSPSTLRDPKPKPKYGAPRPPPKSKLGPL